MDSVKPESFKEMEERVIARNKQRDINRAKLSDEEFEEKLKEFLNQWTWC